MLLKRKYIEELLLSMSTNDVEEVDVSETSNGRIKAFEIERKISKKPLKVGATTTPATPSTQLQPGGEGEGGSPGGLQG